MAGPATGATGSTAQGEARRQDDPRSLVSLVSDLISDLSGLIRSEGRLVRAEMAEAGRQVATGVEMIAAGAVLLLVALIVLTQALVIVVADWVGPAWASVLVGGVLGAIGIAMALKGRGDLKATNLMPDRSIEQTGRDARLARERL